MTSFCLYAAKSNGCLFSDGLVVSDYRVESSGRGGPRATSMLSRLLHSIRKHWKNYTVGFVTLLALVW